MRRANHCSNELAGARAEHEKADLPRALTTRRAVITGAAVGLAALVTDSVISTQPVSAAEGDNVLLGKDNSGATARTGIFSGTDNPQWAELAVPDDPTYSSTGVIGFGQNYGVVGTGVVGVGGVGTGTHGVGVTGNSTGTRGVGVYGTAAAGIGVYGVGTYGVSGEGDTGVHGTGDTYGVYGTDEGVNSNVAVAASLTNTSNTSPALSATTNGLGPGVYVTLSNASNDSPAVEALTFGTGSAVFAETSGGGNAVSAYSQSAAALYGQAASGAGVWGSDGSSGTGPGLYGSLLNPANASPAMKATTAGTGSALAASITNSSNTHPAVLGSTNGSGSGVYGESTKDGGRGTTGQGTNGATGLYGRSDRGTGVFAKSTSGDALRVVGKVAFSRSGLVTVAAKKKSVKVILAGVTTSSMILATLQSLAGSIAVANAIPGSGSFTINLTAAPSNSVKVAWFVIG